MRGFLILLICLALVLICVPALAAGPAYSRQQSPCAPVFTMQSLSQAAVPAAIPKRWTPIRTGVANFHRWLYGKPPLPAYR